MEPTNLADLSAKELKAIAKSKGLTFMANASAKDMLALLNASAGDPPTPPVPPTGDEGEKKDDEDEESELPKEEGEYTVVTNIIRNGKMYKPGDSISFSSQEEADSLLAEKVIR